MVKKMNEDPKILFVFQLIVGFSCERDRSCTTRVSSIRYFILTDWKYRTHNINCLLLLHFFSTSYDGYFAPSTVLLHDGACSVLYCSESIDFIIWQAGIRTRRLWYATCYIKRDLSAIDLPLSYITSQVPSSSLLMPSMFSACVNSIDLVRQTGFDRPPATYTWRYPAWVYCLFTFCSRQVGPMTLRCLFWWPRIWRLPEAILYRRLTTQNEFMQGP